MAKTIETERLKKLKAERAKMDARIHQEQQKLTAAERKKDTRRKILMGAWAFEKSARDNDFAQMALAELKLFLLRNKDRALFGLPPLPDAKK